MGESDIVLKKPCLCKVLSVILKCDKSPRELRVEVHEVSDRFRIVLKSHFEFRRGGREDFVGRQVTNAPLRLLSEDLTQFLDAELFGWHLISDLPHLDQVGVEASGENKSVVEVLHDVILQIFGSLKPFRIVVALADFFPAPVQLEIDFGLEGSPVQDEGSNLWAVFGISH